MLKRAKKCSKNDPPILGMFHPKWGDPRSSVQRPFPEKIPGKIPKISGKNSPGKIPGKISKKFQEFPGKFSGKISQENSGI